MKQKSYEKDNEWMRDSIFDSYIYWLITISIIGTISGFAYYHLLENVLHNHQTLLIGLSMFGASIMTFSMIALVIAYYNIANDLIKVEDELNEKRKKRR